MFHSGSSMFFIQQSPGRFGGQQGDYLDQVRKVTSETVSQIQESVDSKKDLEKVFSSILTKLAKARSDIAIKHNTHAKERFGAFRGQGETDPGMMITRLDNVYLKYNDRLLDVIKTHLKNMKHSKEKFEQTELKVSDNAFGRNTSWDISIMPIETIDQWCPDYSERHYQTICRECGISPMIKGSDLSDCYNSLMKKKNIELVKKNSLVEYKKLKTVHFIKDISGDYKGAKTDWLLVTVRCEMRGKLYAFTQYLTWMCRNKKDDPVQYMSTRPDKTIISLIHQDPFLINDSLLEIGRVFKKAVEWNREEGLEKLTHLIADITYLFSHAMPLERGSAAVGEWLEMALYQYHGFDIKYAEGVCVNMEALTLPYREFMEKYTSFFKIYPINSSQEKPSP